MEHRSRPARRTPARSVKSDPASDPLAALEHLTALIQTEGQITLGQMRPVGCVAIANDNPYGLSSYIQSGDLEHAKRVGRRIRSGHVELNGARWDQGAPFGGYRMSGNGREHGVWGLEEYLETKALLGYNP